MSFVIFMIYSVFLMALPRKKDLDYVIIHGAGHVAFYFWPSALIREFIAIHTEKKHALLFIGGRLFWMWVLIASCMAAK